MHEQKECRGGGSISVANKNTILVGHNYSKHNETNVSLYTDIAAHAHARYTTSWDCMDWWQSLAPFKFIRMLESKNQSK